MAPPGLVRLVDLPIALCDAAVEQWEGMVREYALRALSGAAQPYGLDEIRRAGNALASLGAAIADAPQVFPGGRPGWVPGAGRRDVDLTHDRPGDFAVLQGVLDHVNHLIDVGEVLALPALPEVIALRVWLCDEVAGQSAGASPTPWRLDARGDDPRDTAAAEWDHSLAPPPEDAWVVADDRNRIIAASGPALELLGWTASELVGQRLLVLIPERLREAHVAGYTRSVVSGGGALLGQRLQLPALTRAGSELPVVLTLTRHEARGGRHVYLGRLDPDEPDPAAVP